MKKSLKLFGTLFLTAALFVGCGSGATGNEGAKVLKVSVEEMYLPFIEKIKGAFEEENGVSVEVSTRPMFDTLDALALEGPAGEAADVFVLPNDRIGPLVASGQLAEVKLDNKADYPEKTIQAGTYKDKLYLAPAVVDSLILIYNKDLLPEAPTSFQQLEDLAKDPKYSFDGEAGKSTAFLAQFADLYYGYSVISAYGGYIFGKDGTDPKDIGLNNPGAIEGLNYIKKWYDIYPEGMKDKTSAESIVKDSFNNGKTAAMIGGPWVVKDLTPKNVGYSVIPALPNGKNPSPFAGVKGWGVSSYTKEQELANKWVNFVTNKTNSQTYYEETKEIPAHAHVLEEIKTSDNQLAKTVAAQFEHAVPMPNVPEMAAVWDFQGTIFDIAKGKDAKQAADEGVKTIKETNTSS